MRFDTSKKPIKVSGFTFIRNGEILGYPFVESIKSILPIVDEFVVNVGRSDDNTLQRIQEIGDPKIRIIQSEWNEDIRNDYSIGGFVYGQQKSIALFNTTGDWAFYLEGDEIVHQDDLTNIRKTMEKYRDNDEVEALYFDYLHFYGNKNTYLSSPGWYRTAPRIIKNNIPVWAPKGLYFIVMQGYKGGRYPKALPSGGKIYHYGYVRNEEQMQLKFDKVEKYWSNKKKEFRYGNIDSTILTEFKGTHPKVVDNYFPEAKGVFKADPNYTLTKKGKYFWKNYVLSKNIMTKQEWETQNDLPF